MGTALGKVGVSRGHDGRGNFAEAQSKAANRDVPSRNLETNGTNTGRHDNNNAGHPSFAITSRTLPGTDDGYPRWREHDASTLATPARTTSQPTPTRDDFAPRRPCELLSPETRRPAGSHAISPA